MIGLRILEQGRVTIDEVEDPRPGPGQVLLAMKASGICSTEVHVIYRSSTPAKGGSYRGVFGGHEPAGQVVQVGPDCWRLHEGDRVMLYHISGCGHCPACLRGYPIACSSDRREAYGWQRDGGHAECILAEEKDCFEIPDQLTFVDGAVIACGGASAWESLRRMEVSGKDRIFVAGLGPVGGAVALLARLLGCRDIVGFDPLKARREWAASLGLFSEVASSGEESLEMLWGGGREGADVALDCSGTSAGRVLAIDAAAYWGRVGLLGEGGDVHVTVSDRLLRKQLTVVGSQVTSLEGMRDVARTLARADLHPQVLVSHRFGLRDATKAYALVDGGQVGKVCFVQD